MRSGNKRFLALVSGLLVLAVSLTGCAKSVEPDATVATLDGQEVKMGVANFYAKYQQAQMETYYKQYMGEDMWNQEAEEGKTYADTIKDGVLDTMETLYLLKAHAADYDVTVTDEEKQKIQEAAAAFLEDNGKKVQKLMSADQASVEELMTLYTIQNKMYTATTADVDTNVSDDEAAQKKITYIYFNNTTTQDANGNSVDTTDDQKAEIKKNAEEALAKAKDSGDMDAVAEEYEKTASNSTYGKDDTALDDKIKETADKLEEGQVAEALVETDNGYYIIRMDSLFDREATDSKKESIVAQRKQEAYDKLIEEWKEAAGWKVNEDEWKKVNFDAPLEFEIDQTQQ